VTRPSSEGPGHDTPGAAPLTLLGELLPRQAAYAEAFGDVPEPLFPQEVAALAGAVPKRVREFTTARGCARHALAQLGIDRPPMVPGERGMPPWPPGTLGSLTHCSGYRAAVVARTDGLRLLGIDAEPNDAVPPGVLDLIALPAEHLALLDLAAWRSDVSWDRLLFCAKEAVYKAWFPVQRRWLGFDDVHITFEPGGRFVVDVLLPDTGGFLSEESTLEGGWIARGGFLVTAVTAPASTHVSRRLKPSPAAAATAVTTASASS
jgi:4'-phosphopantetheinyl transferase EntD